MPDKTQPAATEQIPAVDGGISALASAQAPIIFADGVPNYGLGPGFVHATLAAARYQGPGQDHVVVAHLRLTLPAARLLIESLQKAIAMGEKPAGPAN